jgi:superfamily II DNA or RNA helicase
MPTLRPYQARAHAKIKDRFNAGINRQLVKHPTGMGKTPLFAELPNAFAYSAKDILLVLVHREELAQQAADKLRAWNPGRSVGIEMADRRWDGEQLVVASVPTIGRKGSKRLDRFPKHRVRGIVTDEAHHATADSYLNIYDYFDVWDRKDILCLGVTATPNRADGTGLNKVFQEIVDDISILDGIKDGWLSNLRGRRLATTTSLAGVHKRAGDFADNELAELVNTGRRNEEVIRFWLDYGENRKSIGFAVDVQHAKDLADAAKRYGISAEAIWGGDPLRQEKLEMHRKGQLKILFNCQILTEGYDDWEVGCIIGARPTMSESLYTQMIGRGTRIQDGLPGSLIEARAAGIPILKDDCIVLDVVDNAGKHSLATLSSLFGLNPQLDMHGKFVTKVLQEIDEAQAARPFLPVSELTDINDIKTFAEEVDLFKVHYEPEVIDASPNQWHKTKNDNYILLLPNDGHVTVFRDVLDNWQISGQVNGFTLRGKRPSFAEAIKAADEHVLKLGANGIEKIINREQKWHSQPPSPEQLGLAKRLRIVVPPGATKGEVSQRITLELAKRNEKRLLKVAAKIPMPIPVGGAA